MRSWKTSLGGSLHLLGTTLMGIGVVPALNGGVHDNVHYWVAFAGFVLNALGGFFGLLFARDYNVTSEDQGLKTL